MVQWVNGWGQVKSHNLINLDLIEVIQFYLKIYDLLRHPHPWVGVWVVWWMGGSMSWVRSNHDYRINLDLIGIIQFCLKIYNLLRHPQLWVDV